jgi:hypothetical protein
MLYTHGGKSREFEWGFTNDFLTITNAFERIHEYQLREIYSILQWLESEFYNEWFPLANNVEKLGNGTERKGLGVAIYRQRPGDVTHAQGASYLGVVLESVRLFEWNGAKRGIQWRIIRPINTIDDVRSALNNNAV